MEITLTVIDGHVTTNKYGDIEMNVILVGSSGGLHPVGEMNLNRGVCDCCTGEIPEHVGYIVVPDYIP